MTTIEPNNWSTSDETGRTSSDGEERFELDLAAVMEFALVGAVVWTVGFAVVSYLMGWF